ncbi:MAG: hypothetical protein ACLTDX_07400 [[Clostridium] innocuum]
METRRCAGSWTDIFLAGLVEETTDWGPPLCKNAGIPMAPSGKGSTEPLKMYHMKTQRKAIARSHAPYPTRSTEGLTYACGVPSATKLYPEALNSIYCISQKGSICAIEHHGDGNGLLLPEAIRRRYLNRSRKTGS